MGAGRSSNPPLLLLKFTVSALLPLVVASFICWIGGVAGGIFAQALALGGGAFGRSAGRRGLAGALVGAAYGAFTGFFAGVEALALFAPAMSLPTGDAPRTSELFPMFGLFGAGCAALGSLCGVLVLTPLAMATRRSAIRT